jgi:hypothetical protein
LVERVLADLAPAVMRPLPCIVMVFLLTNCGARTGLDSTAASIGGSIADGGAAGAGGTIAGDAAAGTAGVIAAGGESGPHRVMLRGRAVTIASKASLPIIRRILALRASYTPVGLVDRVLSDSQQLRYQARLRRSRR